MRTSWTTHNEKRFIDNLGMHSEERYCPYSPADMLRKYIASFHLRRNWGKVDKVEIWEYATGLLRLMAYRS